MKDLRFWIVIIVTVILTCLIFPLYYIIHQENPLTALGAFKSAFEILLCMCPLLIWVAFWIIVEEIEERKERKIKRGYNNGN